MNDERIKIKKQIDDIDFFIWIFSRYNSKTAKDIIETYKQRRKDLTERYSELTERK